MQSEGLIPPAATADVTACDIEAIQFLGCIQPHGFLVEVSADWLVRRCSANIGDFLDVDAEAVLGSPVERVLGRHIVHELRGQLQAALGANMIQRVFGLADAPGGERFDFALHRVGEATVIEGERHDPTCLDMAASVQPLLMQLREVGSLERLCSQVGRQVRALTGFDRVMIYRFLPDGSGEVVAETKHSGMQAFKGVRFPASDIPRQARVLYERNQIRMIADAAAPAIPVLPALDPSGDALDLSMSVLRAVSPVHLEYLRNMGVAGSMSISILAGNRLWGLIACHHRTPHVLSLQARTGLEFLGQMFSTILDARIRAEDAERQDAARALHAGILGALSSDASTLDDLFPSLRQVQSLLSADGLAVYTDGRLRLSGRTPNQKQVHELMQFLNRAAASRVFSTHELSTVHGPAAEYRGEASGLLAVPISRKPRDYVVFFRRELVQQQVWAGEPTKPVEHTENGIRLSPRRSFEAWRRTVRGQSEYWSDADRHTAETLRVTLLEIMLQITDRAEKQRKLSNDQQDLLIAELNHRVRNILNLIVGLVRQSSEGATNVKTLTEEINARVHALARAHDQLTNGGWGARSVQAMIKVEAGAYLGARAERVMISGPDAHVQPDAFSTLALVMHELITNAAKYGAFRDSRGSVEITLAQDEVGLTIDWQERGGAVVKEPTRRGFGSTIIERAIPHELSGTADVRFEPSGLRARFTVPARYIAEQADGELPPPETTELAPVASADRIEGSVLLVEDNLLIALETEDALHTLGAEDVHIASTTGAALTYLAEAQPGFALLDYNLGREQSVAVADRLSAMRVPFAFATGYGDTATIDERFRGRPVLTKPYSSMAILNAYNATVRQTVAAA